ncbi:intermembrane space import and assembly protein [Histoplasma capsulatum]|uniref:Mitochondrial intermembrane space import and assembly protein 40 n=1 Tax=Ajellomyces capsulatus TaxID=5037 RepID=A0A8A1M7K5_AJECA|nr:intermembrane space import and assembly protein [Histoplasma capsulatum]
MHPSGRRVAPSTSEIPGLRAYEAPSSKGRANEFRRCSFVLWEPSAKSSGTENAAAFVASLACHLRLSKPQLLNGRRNNSISSILLLSITIDDYHPNFRIINLSTTSLHPETGPGAFLRLGYGGSVLYLSKGPRGTLPYRGIYGDLSMTQNVRIFAKKTTHIAFSAPKPVRFAQAKRFINTDSASPSRKPSSWKGTALRWALAVGVVYYYNTSTVFAEEPGFSFQPPTFASNESEDDTSLPTLDSITAAKRAKATSKPPSTPPKSETTTPPPPSSTEKPDLAPTTEIETAPSEAQSKLLTPGELEEEADSEGAFNPETGEINWDCPCLGGMAHGPCGEEFRAAFSCFVYSTEEPKGMNCIDKFDIYNRLTHPIPTKSKIATKSERNRERAKSSLNGKEKTLLIQ